MRGLVLRTMARQPVDAFWLYAWNKPWAIYGVARLVYTRAPDYKWFFLALGGGGVLGLMMLLGGPSSAAKHEKILLTSATAAIVSVLPNLWAFPSFHTVADHVLLFLAFLSLLTAWAVTLLFHYSRGSYRLLHSRFAESHG